MTKSRFNNDTKLKTLGHEPRTMTWLNSKGKNVYYHNITQRVLTGYSGLTNLQMLGDGKATLASMPSSRAGRVSYQAPSNFCWPNG